MIESYAGIAMNGSTPILSSQQVTSCTPNPLKCGGTGGCMGSIPQLGYTYIQLFGHVTEDDYPYTSGTTTDTGDCMYDFMNTAPWQRRDLWLLLCMPVDGEAMVVVSTMAAPLTTGW